MVPRHNNHSIDLICRRAFGMLNKLSKIWKLKRQVNIVNSIYVNIIYFILIIQKMRWLILQFETNLGKLQALSGVTKDQRREYKSKFVDMDIEFQRMKERLETIHLILDDMQVCIGQFITTSFLKMKYFSIFALSLYDEMHVIDSTPCFFFKKTW